MPVGAEKKVMDVEWLGGRRNVTAGWIRRLLKRFLVL